MRNRYEATIEQPVSIAPRTPTAASRPTARDGVLRNQAVVAGPDVDRESSIDGQAEIRLIDAEPPEMRGRAATAGRHVRVLLGTIRLSIQDLHVGQVLGAARRSLVAQQSLTSPAIRVRRCRGPDRPRCPGHQARAVPRARPSRARQPRETEPRLEGARRAHLESPGSRAQPLRGVGIRMTRTGIRALAYTRSGHPETFHASRARGHIIARRCSGVVLSLRPSRGSSSEDRVDIRDARNGGRRWPPFGRTDHSRLGALDGSPTGSTRTGGRF